MAGFYPVGHDDLAHPLFGLEHRAYTRWEAYCWLLDHAAFDRQPTTFQGKPVVLERGQVATSLGDLAARWKWSRSSVQRFIKGLISADFVAYSPTNVASTGPDTPPDTPPDTVVTLITLCKYDAIRQQTRVADTPPEPPPDTPPDTPPPFSQYRVLSVNKEQGRRKGTHPSDECRRQPDLLGAEVVALTPASDDVQQAFAAYQTLARELNLAVPMSLDTNLPRLRQTRRAALRQCLRDCGGMDGWDAVLTAVRGATFITSKRWRSFSLDDLLNRKKLETLMAGGYSQVWTDGPARNAENPALQQMRDHLEEHHEESLFRTMSTVGTVKS